MTVLLLASGRTVNGIIIQETDQSLTARTANETLVIPKDEIEGRKASNVSIMPEGTLEKLADREVRDLIAYLRGTRQVSLPTETRR